MEDPVLNRNLEETKELQQRWSQFHDFVMMAAKQGQKVTPQAEMKFLELKSRIAMLHDGFMGSLKHDVKTGQNIMQIVSDCILLKRVTKYSDAEKQKFEFDWNEGFMLLTEQLGTLEEEQKRLAGINERAYKAQQTKDLWTARFHNFLHSDGLKYSAITLAIIFVLWGVPALGIYNYKRIPFDLPQVVTPYEMASNFVFRPILMSNLEYWNYSAVPQDKNFTEPASISEVKDNKVTPESFKKKVLPGHFGLQQPTLAKALELLDKTDDGKSRVAQPSIDTEHYLAENKDSQFFYIIFARSETASEFVSLLNESVSKMPPARQQKTKEITFVYRSANFVAIGISEHMVNQGHIRGKFKLTDKDKDQM